MGASPEVGVPVAVRPSVTSTMTIALLVADRESVTVRVGVYVPTRV
jgi:hypothetical protein